MNLIVLEELDERWDRFISAHSGLIFHTYLWWKVLKESYGCPMRYLVLEQEGRWVCALPGMIVGNRFFRVLYSLIPYGGFIGDRRYIPEFSSLILDWAADQKIQRVQIVDIDVKSRQELPDFKCVESYRHVLELRGKSMDQIWHGYKDSLKRNIRAALNAELRCERAASREGLDHFYHLYLDSMKRNRALVRYPHRLFYNISVSLIPEFADILFIKHHDRSIAGILLIYSQQTAHYFHGGSETGYLDLRPNDLLFHNAIQTAQAKAKSYFDFMGSSKSMASLIRFKEKWGAEREIVYNYHRDISAMRAALYQLLLPVVNFFRGRR